MQENIQNNLPNIAIVAGMPRTGTTTLYHNLQKHPSVFVPFRKEIFYFSFYYDRGEDWYRGLYRNATPGQVCFDISPDYFYDNQVIERIIQFNPNAKVILGVRDPVEWILSLYNQLATSNLQILPFEEFIQRFEFRVGDRKVYVEFQNVVTRMIEEYQKAFGDNLLLYDFKLFQRDLLSVLRSIELFVGIAPYFEPENFDNVALNASNRRNSKFVYATINRENFSHLLHSFFPDRLLRYLRSMYYLTVAKKEPSDPRRGHSPQNIQLAEEVFAEERLAVAQLFAEHKMLLGSGIPFP